MDLTKIEANKNITIFNSFATTNGHGFSQNVYVPFTPDYMIVRGINYFASNADANSLFLVYCDLVGDHIGNFQIGVPDNINNIGVSTNQGLYFKINRPVTGDIFFDIKNSLNSNSATLFGGVISINLEFIKLKAEKPQVIR